MWSLYKHVSPSGKVYVGISSNIPMRWAANGYYYLQTDTVFARAIRKYGWDSFQHIIIADSLTESNAKSLEVELISLYKLAGLSYNMTDGGDGYKGPHRIEHIEHRVESRISHNNTVILVITKDFNYKVFRSKSEAAKFLGVSSRVVSHVLCGLIGYTCKKCYLWEQDKNDPIDIESIKDTILSSIKSRKMNRLNKRHYDERRI